MFSCCGCPSGGSPGTTSCRPGQPCLTNVTGASLHLCPWPGPQVHRGMGGLFCTGPAWGSRLRDKPPPTVLQTGKRRQDWEMRPWNNGRLCRFAPAPLQALPGSKERGAWKLSSGGCQPGAAGGVSGPRLGTRLSFSSEASRSGSSLDQQLAGSSQRL